MAKKKKTQKVRSENNPPSSAPEQVIVIHFTRGVPKMETNGELQAWHFMTATALLQQVVLQNVLLGTFQRAKVLNSVQEQGSSGLVLP